MKYTITGYNHINHKYIKDEIFDKELIEYKIVDREVEIDNLIDWISEASGNNKEAMKDDLKYLLTLTDVYVVLLIGSNEYYCETDMNYQEILSKIYNYEIDGIKKYRVGFTEIEYGFVEVKANNREEARELADDIISKGNANYGKNERELNEPQEVERFEHEEKGGV